MRNGMGEEGGGEEEKDDGKNKKEALTKTHSLFPEEEKEKEKVLGESSSSLR